MKNIYALLLIAFVTSAVFAQQSSGAIRADIEKDKKAFIISESDFVASGL